MLAGLFGRFGGGVATHSFPALVAHLTRLAFRVADPSHDRRRDGPIGTRDEAEHARESLLARLLVLPGPDAAR